MALVFPTNTGHQSRALGICASLEHGIFRTVSHVVLLDVQILWQVRRVLNSVQWQSGVHRGRVELDDILNRSHFVEYRVGHFMAEGGGTRLEELEFHRQISELGCGRQFQVRGQFGHGLRDVVRRAIGFVGSQESGRK